MAHKNKDKFDKVVLVTGFISSILSVAADLLQIFVSNLGYILLASLGVMLSSFYWIVFYKQSSSEAKFQKSKISTKLALLLVTPIAVGLYFILSLIFSTNSKSCAFDEKKLSVAITDFEDNSNFSSLVLEFLKEEKLPDNLVEIKKISNNFLHLIDDKSFAKHADSLCIQSGILISGIRNSHDRLFYSKIKLINFYQQDLKQAGEVITLRNPDIGNFSIDAHAQILSNFILGLISYRQNDYVEARKLFESCITLNKNSQNKIFLSICRIYLGNTYFDTQKDKAVNEYLKSINLYENKAALINLVKYYYESGDYHLARKFIAKIRKKSGNSDDLINEKIKSDTQNFEPINESKINGLKLLPSGTFRFVGSDSLRVAIPYKSFTVFKYKSQIYYIFTAENDSLGILNSNGSLIAFPSFSNSIETKNYIKTLRK